MPNSGTVTTFLRLPRVSCESATLFKSGSTSSPQPTVLVTRFKPVPAQATLLYATRYAIRYAIPASSSTLPSMASEVCQFTGDYVVPPRSALQKLVKDNVVKRCIHFCGRVIDSSTGIRYSLPASKLADDVPRRCPVLAAAGREAKAEGKAAAAAPSGDDSSGSDAAAAPPPAKRRKVALKPADFGLTEEQWSDFPLTFSRSKWIAICAKIVGRSAQDLRLEEIERRIAKGKLSKEDEEPTGAARSSIRALIWRASPRSGIVRHVAGLVAASASVAALGADEPTVEKKDLRAGDPGVLSVSAVIGESLFQTFEMEGRNTWVKALFLRILTEQKADATLYVSAESPGSTKLVACPSAERFATILLSGHEKHWSTIPVATPLPDLMSTLLSRWSLPIRDAVLASNLIAFFVQCGVLSIAQRAAPEDPDISASLTAVETYVRFAFVTFRDRFTHSRANVDQYARYLAALAAKNHPKPTPKAQGGGRGGAGGGGRGAGGRGAGRGTDAGDQTAGDTALAVLHPSPATSGGARPSLFQHASGVVSLPTAASGGSLSGGGGQPARLGAGTDAKPTYSGCAFPGCTSKPPNGVIATHPLCRHHRGPPAGGGRR